MLMEVALVAEEAAGVRTLQRIARSDHRLRVVQRKFGASDLLAGLA